MAPASGHSSGTGGTESCSARGRAVLLRGQPHASHTERNHPASCGSGKDAGLFREINTTLGFFFFSSSSCGLIQYKCSSSP